MTRAHVTPVALVLALGLALGAVAVGPTAGGAAAQSTKPNPCVGTVTDRPDRATVVSIQGARGGEKTDPMLVSFAPSGGVVGVHNDADAGRWWAYDVDRLPDGDFLMSTTQNRHTVIEEVDAATGEHVSVRDFEGVHDTHDVDLINGDELVMNDMGDEHNRVLVYNLTREEIVWEYRFDEHTDVFPKSGGGPYGKDWTHNNDVERIRPGVFMVSLKNFDQVVAINRSTKTVEWTLGEDENTEILSAQHNPDYLVNDAGQPTVLVADSRNDRVVEYTREDGEWNRTWVLRGGGLNEPRDADRLPSGNTLVSDRRGDRLLEVTPDGEVVWEVYTPWQPYDAERLGTVDESSGPTMVDANTTGTHEMTGGTIFETAAVEACYAFLTNTTSSRLVPADDPGATADGSATDPGTDATRDPTDTPESVLGTTTADGDGFGVVGVTAAGLLVAALALVAARRRTG